MVYRTQQLFLKHIFVHVETKINFSLLDRCKWKPAFGCSFKSQLPSSSNEYTDYRTLICLPGNFPNLQFLNNGQNFNSDYVYMLIQNVVPVLCTNLEGDLLKVR